MSTNWLAWHVHSTPHILSNWSSFIWQGQRYKRNTIRIHLFCVYNRIIVFSFCTRNKITIHLDYTTTTTTNIVRYTCFTIISSFSTWINFFLVRFIFLLTIYFVRYRKFLNLSFKSFACTRTSQKSTSQENEIKKRERQCVYWLWFAHLSSPSVLALVSEHKLPILYFRVHWCPIAPVVMQWSNWMITLTGLRISTPARAHYTQRSQLCLRKRARARQLYQLGNETKASNRPLHRTRQTRQFSLVSLWGQIAPGLFFSLFLSLVYFRFDLGPRNDSATLVTQ